MEGGRRKGRREREKGGERERQKREKRKGR